MILPLTVLLLECESTTQRDDIEKCVALEPEKEKYSDTKNTCEICDDNLENKSQLEKHMLEHDSMLQLDGNIDVENTTTSISSWHTGGGSHMQAYRSQTQRV